ncbi:MAG: carboxypeptidase-like regulatory domain-containing protein [Bacteroidia bacterium]|nr:carboxypeptidase-like regulatory domain-containing protein [Bacteroidia bacterium]
MTSEQESIFNMFRSANQVGLDNSVFVATVPAMATAFTDLKGRITTISGLASLQSSVLSGIAVDKTKLKEKMALLTFNYSGPGRAWAAQNNNDTNYNALNISESKIKNTPDDLAGPVCVNVYTLLNANAVALVPFGLTPAMLNELNTTINDYVAIVPLPNNAINQRQTYTTNIEDNIKNTSDFLERQLDNIVRGQINNNADFVSDYFFAREINDPPVHSTTFKVTVLEAVTNTPLLGARIEAVGTTKVTFTDATGFGELKQFPKDTYTILVTNTGFNPEQQSVLIGLGETKDLTFILTRV